MFETKMPQTVPAVPGFSPSFDYSAFQFDLSLLSDDYAINSLPGNNSTTMISTQQIQINNNNVKPIQIKEEVHSPRSGSPHCLYPSPSYPCLSGGVGELSPNYSRDASPAYPASPYYLPQSPQSAQIYPTSPESTVTTTTDSNSKHPAKREKSFDLLTILHESRLLAESLGYKEDSTDCTVPCTPPRTEENMYKNFDVDLLPKKEESNPLLKEILFKEDVRLLPPVNSSISSTASTCSSSPITTSPVSPILEKSSLRDLLFHNTTTSIKTLDKEIKSDKILKETLNCEDSSSKVSDYQLLREVLRDTSFQRKHNLKPVDLRSVGTEFVEDMVESGECVGDLAREQIEPVLSLAIQQLQKDFDNTCVALGIHPEPRRWSAADVEAWVQWARRQLQLPSVPLESFNMDGVTLASLTEEDFCRRAPQCGSMLYAQLEIWKAAVEESPRNTLAVSWIPTGVAQSPDNESESPSIVSSALDSVKESCSMYYSDDEDEETNSTNTTSGGSKIKSGGSHIHLWQFLKELLQSPGTHGSCIRWLDRNKGVFKIEDSVRVARLWGKRKNRPAMNYDKLSRSIRQYYKKGIMKKTERSQRLVYQFCHPYCL